MNDEVEAQDEDFDLSETTAPPELRVHVMGVQDAELADAFQAIIGNYIRSFGRLVDLAMLDDVTAAPGALYAEAVRTLDRGRAGLTAYTPSDGHVVGIAMTVPVVRSERVKSHIVLNLDFLAGLFRPESDQESFALHTIGHECCHVEATSKFEECFPGRLLGDHPTIASWLAWHVATMVWDEYIVCRICAKFGTNQTEGYEDNFLTALNQTRSLANSAIRAHLAGGPAFLMIQVVNTEYAHLMKFAAYHLGNLDGLEIAPTGRPRAVAALTGHWFKPFFDKLHDLLRGLAQTYGKWTNEAPFLALAKLHEELVQLGGVGYYEMPGRRINFLWPPFVPADQPLPATQSKE